MMRNGIYRLALAMLLAGSSLSGHAAVPTDGSANLLLIISDDLGVDNISVYDEQPINTAQTPAIDALANTGVMFRNAWAHPMCSPSRASILTGRHAFRHGVTSPGGNGTLDASEETLADVLSAAGYDTALFGKWHLGRSDGHLPTDRGFDYWSGSQANIDTYFGWTKSVSEFPGDLNEVTEPGYATTVNVDEMIAWLADMREGSSAPWFVTLAFNAPHGPQYIPPEGLHNRALTGEPGQACSDVAEDSTAECFRAAVEAMDSEISRLLQSLDASGELANTLIVFVGDNGTPGSATVEEAGTPFSSSHAKGTVFEGGINVPLIISGGSNVGINVVGVQSRDQQDKVMALDLFATLAEAGAGMPGGQLLDSISLLNYLDDELDNPAEREVVYSELRSGSDDLWAVSNGTLKLMSDQGEQTCYHLGRDAAESRDLLRRSNRRAQLCQELEAQKPQ